MAGGKLKALFLFTGVLFFSCNAALNGIAVYKQYLQVKALEDATNLMRMQMEHYQNNGPEDPYKRVL